jgi:hypothetical protein
MILHHSPPISKNKTTLVFKDDGFVVESTSGDFGNNAENRHVSSYGHFLKADTNEIELINYVLSGDGTITTTCTKGTESADNVEYECITDKPPQYYDSPSSETIKLYDVQSYKLYEKETYYNGNESMIKSVGTVKNPE